MCVYSVYTDMFKAYLIKWIRLFIYSMLLYVYSFYQFLAIDIQLYSAGVGDSKQKIFNPSARHCGGWARGAGQLAAAADVHHFFRPARSEEWTARWILPRQGARGFGWSEKHAMFSEWRIFCYIMLHPIFFAVVLQWFIRWWKMGTCQKNHQWLNLGWV